MKTTSQKSLWQEYRFAVFVALAVGILGAGPVYVYGDKIHWLGPSLVAFAGFVIFVAEILSALSWDQRLKDLYRGSPQVRSETIGTAHSAEPIWAVKLREDMTAEIRSLAAALEQTQRTINELSERVAERDPQSKGVEGEQGTPPPQPVYGPLGEAARIGVEITTQKSGQWTMPSSWFDWEFPLSLPPIGPEDTERLRQQGAVETANIDGIVEIGGTIRGKRKITVTDRATGTVDEHFVPLNKRVIVYNGDVVRKDQPLAVPLADPIHRVIHIKSHFAREKEGGPELDLGSFTIRFDRASNEGLTGANPPTSGEGGPKQIGQSSEERIGVEWSRRFHFAVQTRYQLSDTERGVTSISSDPVENAASGSWDFCLATEHAIAPTVKILHFSDLHWGMSDLHATPFLEKWASTIEPGETPSVPMRISHTLQSMLEAKNTVFKDIEIKVIGGLANAWADDAICSAYSLTPGQLTELRGTIGTKCAGILARSARNLALLLIRH